MKEPHTNMTSKQTNRSAVGCANPRTWLYYSRRKCKKGISSSTNIDSLSDDLLFEILVRLSVEDIHEKARFVCRRWNRIIHGDAFAYAHLHRTGYGLLLSRWSGHNPTFVAATATQGGGIEVSKLINCEFRSGFCSCNGLILGTHLSRNHGLWIENPATKSCLSLGLPPFCGQGTVCFFGIAYAAASMEYKVVATYLPHDSKFTLCNILTVGVDNTWRHAVIEQLSPEANQVLLGNPLITEGFMHWASSFGNDVVTLNVETEVFVETPAPLAPFEYQVEGFQYSYLSTGRHLSLLICCGEMLWEVWEMKGETGEWRKLLPNIDLKARKYKIQQLASEEDDVFLIPIGWVKYPDALLFSYYYTVDCSCIIYNLDIDEIEFITLPAPVCYDEAVVHKKSLVCLS